MAKYFLAIILLLSFGLAACQQSDPASASSEAAFEAVQRYLQAGDERDTTRLNGVLHPTFRVLINQFKGQAGVTLLDRETYVQLIKAGTIGGEPRTILERSVEIVGNLAFVRVKMESSKLHFDSHLSLIQDPELRWWIVGDTPFVTPRP